MKLANTKAWFGTAASEAAGLIVPLCPGSVAPQVRPGVVAGFRCISSPNILSASDLTAHVVVLKMGQQRLLERLDNMPRWQTSERPPEHLGVIQLHVRRGGKKVPQSFNKRRFNA